jgi:hypothetical protein
MPTSDAIAQAKAIDHVTPKNAAANGTSAKLPYQTAKYTAAWGKVTVPQADPGRYASPIDKLRPASQATTTADRNAERRKPLRRSPSAKVSTPAATTPAAYLIEYHRSP